MTHQPTQQIDVVFVSVWYEGEVRTSAKLDVGTGEVFDIEISDVGTEFEHLLEEYIESVDGTARAAVLRQDEDVWYRVVDLGCIEALLPRGA